MRAFRIIAAVAMLALLGVTLWNIVGQRTADAQMQMPMGSMPDSGKLVPPALAYAKGQEVYFIHPEASDPGVADVLTKMMGPKVLTVRSLAQVPDRLLGDVYVFTNGEKGMGPLGFQPDVFPNVPGDPGYTPLRRINLVTWKAAVTPKVLKSTTEIQQARSRGALTIKRPGVVVNMPILTWPGGKR